MTPSSPAGGAPFLERGLAALDPELTDLARLRPPDGLKLIYARTLSVFSSELQAIGQTALLLRRGRDPVAAIERLQRRLAPLEAQANRGWNALGLHACVNR